MNGKYGCNKNANIKVLDQVDGKSHGAGGEHQNVHFGAQLHCFVLYKRLWYSFVPKNQRWNRSEPLAKKNEAAKSKGVVGNPGITMPTEPHIKQRKAKVK